MNISTEISNREAISATNPLATTVDSCYGIHTSQGQRFAAEIAFRFEISVGPVTVTFDLSQRKWCTRLHVHRGNIHSFVRSKIYFRQLGP